MVSPAGASAAATAAASDALRAFCALGEGHEHGDLSFGIIAVTVRARRGVIAGADRSAQLKLGSAILTPIFVERHLLTSKNFCRAASLGEQICYLQLEPFELSFSSQSIALAQLEHLGS